MARVNPKKQQKRKAEREVGIIDFETDPFKFGRVPAPFACGVLWRGIYAEFWGPECWREAADYMLSIEVPIVWFAHNGGKFDFFFMWPVLENPIKIINGRIVMATLGIHELRDSWAIMPFPLARYKKTEIDYGKFEPETRDTHRGEILNYLHDDCTDLMDLCFAFVKRFGLRLTIAGTGYRELDALCPQEPQNENHDERFRPFYFGGRVECFESGIVKSKRRFKVFDVNSMYPAVMRSCDHPIGRKYLRLALPKLDKDGWIEGYPGALYFAEVEGHNLGALPTRDLTGMKGLNFTTEYGIFHTMSHELRVAIELGKFRVTRVLEAQIPLEIQNFAPFVDKFSADKTAAKLAGDKVGELQSKYVQNAPYGKFAQNPEYFCDYLIVIKGVHSDPEGVCDDTCEKRCSEHYRIDKESEHWRIWAKASPHPRYYDVAIAASVTSAARAVLMRAIAGAKRPIYCDTDSIICEELKGVPIDPATLGAWKLEGSGDEIAIAGKKLYALFSKGEPVKWASKGTKLRPEQIRKVAEGGEVLWQSEAPNFSLTGTTKFIARVAKKTVK